MEIALYLVFPILLMVICIRLGYYISDKGDLPSSSEFEAIYTVLLFVIIIVSMIVTQQNIQYESQRQNAIECYKERVDTRCFIHHLYEHDKTVELDLEGTGIIIKK